jgi:hypothetical protein
MVGLAGFSSSGFSDETTETALTQRLDALQQQVESQQAELASLRQQLKQLGTNKPAGDAQPQGVTERVAALEQQAKSLEEFAKIDWSGDFRIRFYDGIFNQQDTTGTRHRARARFRLGATYPVTEQLEFGARLATGGSDGDTANVTLGDLFTKDAFDLDRYYFRYRPREGVEVVGGKFENPFWVTQATWDVDLQPEGVAAAYTVKELGGVLDSATVRSGFYTLSEIAGDGDAFLIGNQVVLSKQLAEKLTLETSLANYITHKPHVLPTVSNAVNRDSTFMSDFKVVDTVTKLSYDGWAKPVSLLFDYGHNLEAASAIGDDYYWVEASVGKIKKPWDWQVRYQSIYIQQDATIAALAGNATTPETNMTRQGLLGSVRVLKNTDLGVNYYVFRQREPGSTATTDEDSWLSRFQMELITNLSSCASNGPLRQFHRPPRAPNGWHQTPWAQ